MSTPAVLAEPPSPAPSQAPSQAPAPARHLHAVRSGQVPGDQPPAGPAPETAVAGWATWAGPRVAYRSPRASLPDPRPRAAAAVRVLLEVLAGDRPARQVSPWVSPKVLAGLEQRRAPGRRARHTLLRSVHVAEPVESVAEVTAVVRSGERFRAVALRLEGRDGRWLVTALRVG